MFETFDFYIKDVVPTQVWKVAHICPIGAFPNSFDKSSKLSQTCWAKLQGFSKPTWQNQEAFPNLLARSAASSWICLVGKLVQLFGLILGSLDGLGHRHQVFLDFCDPWLLAADACLQLILSFSKLLEQRVGIFHSILGELFLGLFQGHLQVIFGGGDHIFGLLAGTPWPGRFHHGCPPFQVSPFGLSCLWTSPSPALFQDLCLCLFQSLWACHPRRGRTIPHQRPPWTFPNPGLQGHVPFLAGTHFVFSKTAPSPSSGCLCVHTPGARTFLPPDSPWLDVQFQVLGSPLLEHLQFAFPLVLLFEVLWVGSLLQGHYILFPLFLKKVNSSSQAFVLFAEGIMGAGLHFWGSVPIPERFRS